MIFACYQVPLKHLSTLESLQGNGSKVPECNQEPGPHLLKADHAHQSFNAGSHFRMSQDAKKRSVGIISAVLASGCPRNTQDWSDRWSEVSAIEGWWNWLTGISKRLPTTIQSTIHLWLTAMPERRFRYHCTNQIMEGGSRETMNWCWKYQLLDYLLAAVYGSTKGITKVSTKVNKNVAWSSSKPQL